MNNEDISAKDIFVGLSERDIMMPDCRWRKCKPNQIWLIRRTGATALNEVRIKRIFNFAVELEAVTPSIFFTTAIYEFDKDFNFVEQLEE